MEATENSEQIIQSSFSSDEYEKLLHFFQNVWLSNAEYKIFMARRAFNLNFAFMSIENVQYKDEYKTENILSNTALLLCAEEIVDYYLLTESFPKIILVDDLLIHGRGITKLIDNLEDLILSFLEKHQKLHATKQMVHRQLLSAINIYVFAQNTTGILLDGRFILKSVMQMSASGLKAMSQKISRALQQCGVANTSYVLSAELPLSFYKKEYGSSGNSDGSSLFQYRGNILSYYYRNSNDKILETIRFYYSGINCSMKRVATSLTIFGDIAYEEGNDSNPFNTICRNIVEEIKQIISYSRIADILSYEQPCLIRPRAQMLSYLLSILGYSSFYRKKISAEPQLIYKALLQSDYQKIAANFDRPKKLQFEFIQLFNYVSQRDNLRSRIFKILADYVGPLNGQAGIAEMSDNYQIGRCRTSDANIILPNSDPPHEIAEDIFYEVGMNKEYDAHYCAQTKTKFDLSKPGNDFIRLEQYLQIMKRYKVDAIPSIGCILNLMDSGLLAMNMELNSDQQAVQCTLKAGELSTFVLPRRFSVLVPALSIVERECFKKASGKKAVVSQFIDYLQEHCYQENGIDSKEDVELLYKLSRSKSFLLYMYAAGQNFQDWDVNLLTNEDRLSHGIDERGKFSTDRYILWTSTERKRIRYYIYCAKTFLRSREM